jgi:hypothetical protein
MWKKFLITILFFSFFWNVYDCLAQDPLQNIAQTSGYSTNVDEYSLSQTVGGYIKAILGMLGVIFFALSFYAGFLWLTASGDESKIEKAKKIITAATIGLIIIFMSYGITTLVLSSASGVNNPKTPIGN